jgi:hypothetical protein
VRETPLMRGVSRFRFPLSGEKEKSFTGTLTSENGRRWLSRSVKTVFAVIEELTFKWPDSSL